MQFRTSSSVKVKGSQVVREPVRWRRGICAALFIVGADACTPGERAQLIPDGFIALPVSCTVMRDECTAELLADTGQFSCVSRVSRELMATVCTTREDRDLPTNACNRVLCTPDPFTRPYGYAACSVLDATPAGIPATAPEIPLPAAGVCRPIVTATGPARVEFRRRSLVCTPAADGVACSSLGLTQSESVQVECLDVSRAPATVLLLPSTDERGRAVRIDRFESNHPDCVPAAETEVAFALRPGPFATATAAGTSTVISALGGHAVVNQACDIDGDCRQVLSRLRVNVGAISVGGMQATNVVVRNTIPAPLTTIPDPDGTRSSIAREDLKLIIEGQLGGARTFIISENRESVAVTMDAGGIRINGTFRASGLDLVGRPFPVAVSVNLQGTTATPRERACLDASSQQRLFGFEEPESWRAPRAVATLVAAPVTQGCGALGLEGAGYFTIEGGPFDTTTVPDLPAVSVDLFIPGQQPNPYWLGALQMYLTCPSANAFNQYIGQVELTGKPEGRYSTLRFPLPGRTAATLRQSLQDCFFTLALNVNQTQQRWLVDNLRFTR